jgi:hypothetical protein
MYNKFGFREPLNKEPDGTYITVGQMQFWLNRSKGSEKFKAADPEFLDYYDKCRVYNLVSDIMEENEEAAIMYWDTSTEALAIGYPERGDVADALSSLIHANRSEESDGEDSWSAGI